MCLAYVDLCIRRGCRRDAKLRRVEATLMYVGVHPLRSAVNRWSLMYVGAYIVADRYIRRYMHLPSNLPTFSEAADI